MFTRKIYIVVCLLSSLIATIDSSDVIKKELEYLEIDTDPKVQQRISILVGSAKAGEDGDESGGSLIPSGDSPVQSTNYASCGGRCCFQYTWQGYIQDEDIPKSPSNATCEAIRAQRKDDNIACFDPVVYTTGTSGNSPDVTKLRDLAQENNWNIYCPLTGTKSCMSLRYYSRGGGGNKVSNETRFCGSVTEINSGKKITSGCYKEKAKGYTREVCVCDDRSFCNKSSRTFGSIWYLPVAGILSLLVMLQ